jgi:hypothetical protein
VPLRTALSKTLWVAITFRRTYVSKSPKLARTPGWPARWKTPSKPSSARSSAARSSRETSKAAAFSSFSKGS